MSLARVVQEQVAVKQREARAAANSRREAAVRGLEKWVSERTGRPAVFVGQREVAHRTYVSGGVFNRSVEAVGRESVEVVRVDDMEFAVARSTRDGKVDGLYVLFQDAEFGEFRAAYSYMSLFGWDRKSEDERFAAFADQVAQEMAKAPKHPAVEAREKGWCCPSCGRDFA